MSDSDTPCNMSMKGSPFWTLLLNLWSRFPKWDSVCLYQIWGDLKSSHPEGGGILQPLCSWRDKVVWNCPIYAQRLRGVCFGHSLALFNEGVLVSTPSEILPMCHFLAVLGKMPMCWKSSVTLNGKKRLFPICTALSWFHHKTEFLSPWFRESCSIWTSTKNVDMTQ